MPSWMVCAASAPAIRPASARAMSMPEDTPAAVTYLPSNTTRSLTASAPSRASWISAVQCVVARRPVSSPARARISEPVHTEVVQVVVWSAVRSQSKIAAPSASTSVPGRLGREHDLGSGQAVEHVVGAHRVQGREPGKQRDDELHGRVLSESAPVLGGRDVQRLLERPAHAFGGVVATGPGDLLDPVPAVFE